MLKPNLIDIIAESAPITHSKATEIVDLFFGEMTDTLLSGGRVTVAGFGSLSVRQRKARMGKNPKTGEAVKVPAKTVVKWTASKNQNRSSAV